MTTTTTFQWTFTMADGTTETTSSVISDLIFSGDDITNCTVNIKDSSGNRFSALVPMSYFLGRIYQDTSIQVNGGQQTLMSDMATQSKALFQKYYSGDVSSVTNQQWVNLLSNVLIIVVPSGPTGVLTDALTGNQYGTFTFLVGQGTKNNQIFKLTLNCLDKTGAVTNITKTLYSGDSLSVFGTNFGTLFGYTTISKQITYDTGNYIATGDLSTSGSTVKLTIPEAQTVFTFAYTGTATYSCSVSALYFDIKNYDLRRTTVYGGGGLETYTLDDSALSSSVPVVIDSLVYGNSQDVSEVLISYQGSTWKITYWCSGNNARFRSMAQQMFV